MKRNCDHIKNAKLCCFNNFNIEANILKCFGESNILVHRDEINETCDEINVL